MGQERKVYPNLTLPHGSLPPLPKTFLTPSKDSPHPSPNLFPKTLKILSKDIPTPLQRPSKPLPNTSEASKDAPKPLPKTFEILFRFTELFAPIIYHLPG